MKFLQASPGVWSLPAHVVRVRRRQGFVRHQLARRGRAWRILPSGRRWHLCKIRARRHDCAGRPAGQQRALARGWTVGLLHGRQPFAGLRRGRARRPHRRGRRGFPKRSTNFHVAPWGRTRHMGGPAEGDDGFRGQGGACHFLSVDDVGLRFQGGKSSGPIHSTPGRSSPTPIRFSKATSPPSRSPSSAKVTSSPTSSCSPTTDGGPTPRRSRRAQIWSRIIRTSCSGSSTRLRSAGTTISTATMRKRTP